jgi:hypothetical protein
LGPALGGVLVDDGTLDDVGGDVDDGGGVDGTVGWAARGFADDPQPADTTARAATTTTVVVNTDAEWGRPAIGR